MTTSINLPAATFLRNVAGKAIKLDWSLVPAAILPMILEVGAKTVLTNAFNGGGKDASDADKLAAMEKKMAAWYRGEFNVVTRGDSLITAMREQYIDERRAATQSSRKDVEASIKQTVASVFGKDEAATFGKFLDAVATLKAKATRGDFATIRAEIEEGLEERTLAAAAKRDAEAKSIDMSQVDLSDLGF
jgi:BMFP domain-containing protein YqiC